MKYRRVIEHLMDILNTETLWKSIGMGLCYYSYISLALTERYCYTTSYLYLPHVHCRHGIGKETI